jgi:hypothetical protein
MYVALHVHVHRQDRFMQCRCTSYLATNCTAFRLKRISDSTNIFTGSRGFRNNESRLYIRAINMRRPWGSMRLVVSYVRSINTQSLYMCRYVRRCTCTITCTSSYMSLGCAPACTYFLTTVLVYTCTCELYVN